MDNRRSDVKINAKLNAWSYIENNKENNKVNKTKNKIKNKVTNKVKNKVTNNVKNKIKNSKEYNIKNYVKNGSVTVEAAMILPLIIMVFVSVIMYVFFLHDVVVIKGVTEEFLAERKYCEEKEIQDDFDKDYILIVNSDMFVSEPEDEEIIFSGDKVCIKSKLIWVTPFFGFEKKVEIERETEIGNKRKKINTYKSIGN